MNRMTPHSSDDDDRTYKTEEEIVEGKRIILSFPFWLLRGCWSIG